MPRAPRQKSKSGIYHIMLRGINGQVIFKDEDDFHKFTETIQGYKAISNYKVFAYCLMSNHIHMLIKVEKEDLDLIMKRIAGSYVYWYNWKYHRQGHLFQDRFKSEVIEDDAYFFTVLRYIHQNPLKAGLVKDIVNYKYSSFYDYVNNKKTLVDIEFALSMLDKEEFIKFNTVRNDDKCLEINDKDFRLNDIEAMEIIEKVSKCRTVTEFQLIEKETRNKYIRKMRECGLSIRQISRLTGISKGCVEGVFRQ